MVCVRYRPRQPRASPVWQILHDHAAKLPGLSVEAAGAITAFLDCGDLHAGFTRLHCPDCGHEFLLAVLVPRGLDRPHERPFALGPPRPEVAVMIDAATGDCHALDPPDFPPGLPYPPPRDEPIRFRAEVMEPDEDFDQTGFELPLPPQVALAEAGQGELFGDDFAQPDSAAGEPVFWNDESGQASRDDDVVQDDPAELL